jgi:hypothetical protein
LKVDALRTVPEPLGPNPAAQIAPGYLIYNFQGGLPNILYPRPWLRVAGLRRAILLSAAQGPSYRYFATRCSFHLFVFLNKKFMLAMACYSMLSS